MARLPADGRHPPPFFRGPRRQRLTRSALLGILILGCMLAACLATLPWTMGRIGPVIDETGSAMTAPRRFERSDLDQILLPPTWAPHRTDERARLYEARERGAAGIHFFGTDRLGRDLFVRTLAGGGISMTIGIAAAAIAVVIGVLYGSLAGYLGGRADAVMMRIVDIFYGLPYILLVVLLAVAVEGMISRFEAAASNGSAEHPLASFVIRNKAAVNVVTLLVAIGGVSWLTMARVIRGQVLSLKEQPFMEACRAIGVPFRVQFVRHLLPNLLGPIVVYATLTVPQAILQESFLSFLGIGVQPPVPSWGNLAAEGLSELNPIRARWWLLLWPCLLLAMTLLSLNFVGEGLREFFDPRRRNADRI